MTAPVSEVHRFVGWQPMFPDGTPKKGPGAMSDEHLAMVRAFQPRAGDVYISTMAKTGTTWLQMICHQLRCPGDTDFEEICCVVPWLEKMPVMEQPLDGDQLGNPRCFKTHRPPSQLPDPNGTAKFIFTIRDPVKTLVSQFKFTHSKKGTDITDINEWVATLPTAGRT